MKTTRLFLPKLMGITICLFLITNVLKAQETEYWINDDFSSFEVAADYFEFDTVYQLAPGNIDFTTFYANIEAAEGICNNEGVNMRIRGLKDNGYVYFTVPNAGTVTLELKGKSDAADRIIFIYRNDELIETVTGLDRDHCETFTEEINSENPVTYKITGGDTASTKPIIITSIAVTKYDGGSIRNENPLKNGTMIYPNPTNDYLYVECKAIDQCRTIELYNIAGQRLMSQKVGTAIDPIDMTNLAPGIYLLQLKGNSGSATYKVIKQ